MGNAPDRTIAVFSHEQRTILRDRNADWASPDLRVADHEAGHEILVFARRLAGAVKQQANHFMARPLRAIPRAMKSHESASLVRSRKVVTFIKDNLKWSGMGLHQYVRNRYFVLQIRPRILVARIFIRPDIVPGPSVEGVLLDRGGIFERRIVAKLIPFVHHTPETSGRGMLFRTTCLFSAYKLVDRSLGAH